MKKTKEPVLPEVPSDPLDFDTSVNENQREGGGKGTLPTGSTRAVRPLGDSLKDDKSPTSSPPPPRAVSAAGGGSGSYTKEEIQVLK